MENLAKTIELIKKTFPESKFDKVKYEWIDNVEKNYSEIPVRLKELYNKLGYGTVGDSYYSVHVLMEPDEIYDPITAKELKGKLIVGDDLAGDCHAYDTNDNWSFGYIDCNGQFEKLEELYSDFIDFLNQLCLNELESK